VLFSRLCTGEVLRSSYNPSAIELLFGVMVITSNPFRPSSYSMRKRAVALDNGSRGGNRMAKPVAKFKAGQVSAALWENEITANGRKLTVLKASVQRRYKDKDGSWKSSGSFSRNEIPLREDHRDTNRFV